MNQFLPTLILIALIAYFVKKTTEKGAPVGEGIKKIGDSIDNVTEFMFGKPSEGAVTGLQEAGGKIPSRVTQYENGWQDPVTGLIERP